MAIKNASNVVGAVCCSAGILAYVVLDVSECMIIRAVEFTTLKENKSFHAQYLFNTQCIFLTDKLENILLIELRRNELDKYGGSVS